MNLFEILSQDELDKMTEDERKAYDEALEAFIEKFRKNHPNGVEVKATVKAVRGASQFSPKGAIEVYPTSELPGALYTKHINVIDLFARNAGFSNTQHMSMVLSNFLNKGEVTFNVNLRVEGDTWTAKKTGKTGTINKTHYDVQPVEYVPSPAISGYVAKAKFKAIESGFTAMLNNDVPSMAIDVADADDSDAGDTKI